MRDGARIAAGTATAVALLATLWYLPRDARSVWRDTRNGAATPRAEREVAPAHVVGILDRQAIVAASRVIRRNATYYAMAGPHAPQAAANARFYVGFFAAFTLLPRRATPTPKTAEWVLSYGGLDSLGLRYSRIVKLGPGVVVAEAAR